MPLPSPSPRQKKTDFLQACMADSKMRSEYPDSAQRYAVCNSQWAKRNKGK